MTPIPFFTDDIAIAAHTATNADHLARPITLAEFANGVPIALYETDNGELYARKGAGHGMQFIQGPEHYARPGVRP